MFYANGDLIRLLDITPPFLCIDSVEVNLSEMTAKGIQKLDKKDWFFDCHLPSKKVMPATLIVEGMLQTLASLIYSCENHLGLLSLITDINVKIKESAKPETELEYHATLLSNRRGIIKGQVKVLSNGNLIGSGSFEYATPELLIVPTK